MGNIGDSFGLGVPTVGAAGPQYATTINQILTEVMLRLATKVPLSSVNFAADLNVNGQAVLNAAYVTLANTATSPGSSPVNRVTAFSGDLWYVSPSGPIQLTTGNQLNAASIGGITGAYGGANPAQFRYDNVNSRYDAYANFGTSTWADVRALGFDIAAGATSSVFARLLFGGASNKTYTLPAAAASTADRPLFMDTAGNITVGHGNKVLSFPVSAATIVDTTNAGRFILPGGGPSASVVGVTSASASNATLQNAVTLALTGLIVGQRVISVAVDCIKVNTATTTYSLRKYNPLTNTVTTIASVSSTTNGTQTLTITPGAPEVVTSGLSYSVDFAAFGASSANEAWIGARVTLDQPV